MKPIARIVDDVWALQFGRADRWWAWAAMMSLACLGLLTWAVFAPSIVDAELANGMHRLVLASALGVAIRTWVVERHKAVARIG